MSTLLVRLRTALVRLGFAIGRRRTIRARVVLATSHAATIGGNLRAIADELDRRSPPIRTVVLASRAAPGDRKSVV